MSEYVLEMQSITKTYPGVVALSNVTFKVRRGEVHGLLGENGAGKSTLIKVLSGAIQPDSGRILFEGHPHACLDPRQALDLGIGVIYQELNLIPYLTVAENIFLGNEYRQGVFIDDKRMLKKTKDLLALLGIDIDPTTRVRDLSVAYQQMVEITKAVSRRVKIIIMDEPTAPLSKNEVDHLFQLIATLKAQQISIIYISHRLQEIFEVADNVTVLRDGHYIDTLEVRNTTRRHLISLMVGRDLGETFPEGGYAKDTCVLRVADLCGERFRNISFELRKGEILGIAGLVGAGRSEVGRAIFGADPISSGEIFIAGKKVHLGSPKEAIRHGIGLIPEDRKQQGLLLKLSVLHNVSLSSLKVVKKRGLLSTREERSMVGRFVKELGVRTPHLDQLVNYLSGGNQQKTVLAKWLATRSQILIFDEPTRGIDVGAKQEIYQLMRQLTRDGISIITISSEMPELIGISDRILVMCKGEIRGELSKENFTQDKILELAAGFTA